MEPTQARRRLGWGTRGHRSSAIPQFVLFFPSRTGGSVKFLAISTVLAIIPLAGVVYIATSDMLFTVDGLFMILMLLSISGIFGLNATIEARDLGLVPFLKPAPTSKAAMTGALPAGVHIQTGVVRELHFFESHVGEQNKTVVEFVPDGTGLSRYISFIGNVKEQLPLGARMRITYRVEDEGAVLIGREQLFGYRFGRGKNNPQGKAAAANSGTPAKTA
jgi:hypothetical protein